MINQGFFNRDFARKTPFPARGFEPMIFQPADSCQGIKFQPRISISLFDHLDHVDKDISKRYFGPKPADPESLHSIE